MDALKKITKARAGLILDAPFFGSLALRLRLKEDSICKTLWTNGVTLGFNPSFIDTLSLEQTKGVVAHEVMHCACSHHARRNNRNPKKWNIAGDYVINNILINSKFVLPQGALINTQFDGKSTDEIYNLLPDSQGGQDGQDGQGDNGNDPDPGNCGEVRDAEGENGQKASQTDLNKAEQDWKIAVNQAATQAKSYGPLPGGLERLIDEIVNPKVDWKSVLRQFIETSAKNDYTWSYPNKRYIHQGLYLPSLKSEELNNVVIGIDTSASIGQDELNQFSSEISSILEEYETNIDVLYCDAKIQGHDEFTSQDLPLQLDAKGGGGTDFRPVFDYVDEQGMQPACLIYLTDMQCHSYPENIPDYPVLWVATSQGGATPPFGERIEME